MYASWWNVGISDAKGKPQQNPLEGKGSAEERTSWRTACTSQNVRAFGPTLTLTKVKGLNSKVTRPLLGVPRSTYLWHGDSEPTYIWYLAQCSPRCTPSKQSWSGVWRHPTASAFHKQQERKGLMSQEQTSAQDGVPDQYITQRQTVALETFMIYTDLRMGR